MTIAARSLARDIASQYHHRAAYLCEVHSDFVADLREIRRINFAKQKANFSFRKGEMLSSYGYGVRPVDDKPFAYADGVAIIPIHGILVNRFSGSYSFATGYNFIRSQMNFALDDDDVKLIVYDINSPGGVASGCSELALEMFQSRDQKPSLAVIDARCYSAAYFLGSSATRMICTPSGGTGSIGCVAMHVDHSGMLEQDGLKVTFVKFGDQKVDGNPYEKLSARAKQTIQREVDYHGELFVAAVSRNRDISEDDVRKTEAATFIPTEALELGFIDDILTPDEAVSRFFNDSDDEEEDGPMTVKAPTTAEAAASPASEVPATAAAPQINVGDEVKKALAAERLRTSGIRNCEEAAGREKLANHLADNTEMSVDDAKAILAASAKEPPAAAPPAPGKPNGFVNAMDHTQNPNVGADGEEPRKDDEPGANAERLLQNYVGATGRKIIPLPRSAA